MRFHKESAPYSFDIRLPGRPHTRGNLRACMIIYSPKRERCASLKFFDLSSVCVYMRERERFRVVPNQQRKRKLFEKCTRPFTGSLWCRRKALKPAVGRTNHDLVSPAVKAYTFRSEGERKERKRWSDGETSLNNWSVSIHALRLSFRCVDHI